MNSRFKKIFEKLNLYFSNNPLKLFVYNFITIFLGVFFAYLIYQLSYVDTSLYRKELINIDEKITQRVIQDFDYLDESVKSSFDSDLKLIKYVVNTVKAKYVDRSTITNFNIITSTIDSVILNYPELSGYYSDNMDFNSKNVFDLESILNTKYKNTYILLKTAKRSVKFNLPVTTKMSFEYPDSTDWKNVILSYPDYTELVSSLLKIIAIVKQSYVDAGYASTHEVTHMVLSLMLESLDPHCTLFSEDSFSEFSSDLDGKMAGIGVSIHISNYMFSVVEVIKGSPAEQAGIIPGDRIIKVNDEFTFGKSLNQVGDMMKGKVGQIMDLDLISSQERGALPKHIQVKRQMIDRKSVQSRKIDSNFKLLYLKIDSFAKNTKEELSSSIQSFNEKYGSIQGMVLDLRGNPGGLLSQAIEVADVFLNDSVIVLTKGGGEDDVTYRSSKKLFNQYSNTKYPIIILVDQNSASASEILAGSLQDNARALIIGQPTFGKGSVQAIYSSEEKDVYPIKITISRYYTPNGKTIQNIGIIPDVWLQPVYKNSSNLNLLGSSRFDNENFYKHRLNATSLNSSDYSGGYLSYNLPVKGYFLTDRDPSSVYYTDSSYELDIAKDILEEFLSLYQGKENQEIMSRPFHWLGVSKNVTKKLITDTTDFENWLSLTLGISWSDNKLSRTLVVDKFISKTLTPISLSLENKLSGFKGQNLTAKVKIKNNTDQTFDRLSVFIGSSASDMQSSEVLIDKLLAGSEKIVKLNFSLPYEISGSNLPVFIGVSQDSVILQENTINIKVGILPSVYTSLKYKIVKQDKVKPDSLKFKIELSNLGKINLNDLDISLINLSGSRMKILSGSKTIHIKKQGSSTIDVILSLPPSLTTNQDYYLGLNIVSSNLEQQISKVIRINFPNGSFSKNYILDVL